MINSLTYNGYTASISYSSADEVFFGKVLGINDLVNFEGTSVSELKESFQEAVDDYIETCKHWANLQRKRIRAFLMFVFLQHFIKRQQQLLHNMI